MPASRFLAFPAFAIIGLLLTTALPHSAAAAIIEVARVVEIAPDGRCSLIEAIINAENDSQTHVDCTRGAGTDTIVLLEEIDYVVTEPYAGSDNALPLITDNLIIEGQGSRILRDVPVPFRLMELAGGSFELKDLILSSGLSTSPMTGGGAILVRAGATLVIENSVFELNSAGGDSAFGGALRIDNSDVEIRDSLFEDNQVFTLDPLMGGGAIAQFDGFLEVRRSAFINNKGDIVCNPVAPDSRAGGGGALRIEALTSAGAYADIYDSTFSGNIGRVGGAIDVRALLDTGAVGEDVLVRLFRSTVAENIASGCPGVDGAGSGLFVEEDNGGSGLIQYGTSVIHGNGLVENGNIVGRDCFSLQPTQTFASLDGNVLDEVDSCTASLQDRFADAVDEVLDLNLNGDHYLPLQAGPAFDHPDAFFNCSAGTTTDQLGKIRGNGPGQGGAACDSGAVELYVAPMQQTLTVTLAGSGSGEVTSQPAGIQCPGVCEFDFPNNEKVILTATPGPVSEFIGWGGACSGDGICLVSMDQAREVIATFGPRPTQLVVQLLGSGSVTSVPAGIDCPSDCDQTYLNGTLVELTAQPAPGSVFDGWGGGCAKFATTPTCTLSMVTDFAVLGTFSEAVIDYELVVSLAGPGRITSSPAGIDCPGQCTFAFAEDTVVSLNATPDAGGAFQNFGGDCSGASCQLTMTRDYRVDGVFLDDDALFIDGFE